jgi:MFS family permease
MRGEAFRIKVGDAVEAFRSNFRVRDLRRTQLSFAGAWSSEWALTVGLAIVAFRAGGAGAVGVVALLRLLPAAIAGPFLATFADRFRRERVITAIGVVRAASIGGAAALLAMDAPAAPVYALAVVATVAGTPFRAAHSALLPSLCNSPHQLTSANAVRGMLDSLSTLLGPLLAAVLLAASTPAAVFAAAAALSLWSGALVMTLRYEAPPRPQRERGQGLWTETVAGVRTLAAMPTLAMLFGLAMTQTFTRGCLNVLTVVVAIDLLHMGEAGVGVLSAAVGAGAVLGSLGAAMLPGSARLGMWYGISIVLWGLPLVVMGLFAWQLVAVAMLATVGVANALLDVAGFSLFARLAPDDVLGRVFGVFEALVALSIGIGSVLAPAVIDGIGVRGALIALGCVAPVCALAAWHRLRVVDARMVTRDKEFALLSGVKLLRPLPLPVMEHLARHTKARWLVAGETVCRQDDVGDHFYVIADGEVDVLRDGEVVGHLHTGDGFGEIALLRDVARTTTVLATTDLEVHALARDIFVPAVSGYSASAAAANTKISGILESLRARGVGP